MDKNYKIEKKPASDFAIRDMLDEAALHWHWFVISIVITLSVAYFIVKTIPPAYNLSAIIMINDKKGGGSFSNDSPNFLSMGNFSEGNSAQKEVYILKSRRLTRDVVQRLKLNTSYGIPGRFHDTELYKSSPAEVFFIDQKSPATVFTVTPVGENKYQVSDLKTEGQETDFTTEAALGDTVHSPGGTFVVYKKPGASFSSPVIITNRSMEAAADQYIQRIQVTIEDEKSGAIRIALTDNNYEKTADIINTLIAIYNEYTLKEKGISTENTANFVKERIRIIGMELGDIDKEIEEYKKANKLTDIEGEAGLYLTAGSQSEAGAAVVRTQINQANKVEEYLSDPQTKDQLLPLNTGITDAAVDGLLNSYNYTLQQRNRLLSNSSNKSIAVQELNKSLESARSTLLLSVQSLRKALQVQLNDIHSQQNIIARRIQSVPTQQKEVQAISRQQKIKEELYLFLLQKREENALNLAISESSARVVDFAEGSKSPVSSNKTKILSIAFLSGLLIPPGLIYIKQLLDTKVRSKKDIESQTSLPMAGEIPLVKSVPDSPLFITNNEHIELSEAFRVIRTNLAYLLPKKESAKIVLITSTFSGEGKTFIAINMAKVLALSQKKVLLINTDIRKKSEKSEPFNGKTGLTNYLSGTDDLKECIIKKGCIYPTLDVIDAGPIPPNPTELLLSEKLDNLISSLQEEYHYIILDSAPTSVADAMVVSRVTDLTIYVIRQGKLDRRLLPDIETQHRDKKFKNMSAILNGYRKQYKKYGYEYGYKISQK